MTRIAIVGGAGFVGHHASITFALGGHDVLAVDSLMINNLYSELLGRLEPFWAAQYRKMLESRLESMAIVDVDLKVMDACDYDLLSRVLKHFEPEIVIHLAAVAHIDRANKEPWHCFRHSLRTLENSLDYCRTMGAGLVYFSSSTAYGNFQGRIHEDHPTEPIGIYGNLKLCGELMVKAYNQVYGLPAVIIRPQALYGPRCISGRVTQIFIERAIRGLPLEIHGAGDAEHDFTYIADLLQALDLIVQKVEFQDGFFRIWNVTGECATAMIDLAELVAQRYDVPIEWQPADKDKPCRGTMLCDAIRQELGYVPAFDIKRGMKLYMDFYDMALRKGVSDVGQERKTA